MVTSSVQASKEKENRESFVHKAFQKEAIRRLSHRRRLSGKNSVSAPMMKHFEDGLEIELKQLQKGSEGNKRSGIPTKAANRSNSEIE